ncbi:muscle M-line assembly protein unc-89-like [Condylostylus longicornis]|uniref:muscle M-line assembly protein unc-89-like n=1 Tax=Condylostylus longicornis TaxID=2530218 RepID=UPI00244DE988|nr:muscle M-line assembly protein unc-89-like [Condylostylus longicornis]
MGTADIENSSLKTTEKLLQTSLETVKILKSVKQFKKSLTPLHKTKNRDSTSMTPTRGGRSLTPFSLYLSRHSSDPSNPKQWRSITPFIDRKNKEKTPFELGKDIRDQLIAHKMVIDRASVMDITDDSSYEPTRYLVSDAAVIDRASVMDISNVEVVYLIEEYDETEKLAVVEQETKTKEKKKSKRSKKSQVADGDEESGFVEKVVDSDGTSKAKTTKSKKKTEKKKKTGSDSDDDLSPSPPITPPKLTLQLEMGGGSKINKKIFEKKAAQSEIKPPIKKVKQEIENEKPKVENMINSTNEKDSLSKTKKKKKSITSLNESDTGSIRSRSKKVKSSTGSTASIVSNTDSSIDSDEKETDKLSENTEILNRSEEEQSEKSDLSSVIEEDLSIKAEIEENETNLVNDIRKNSLSDKELSFEKLHTPTPPRRSPSPAFPPKQSESYYEKMSHKYGKTFSDQIRVFNSIKRDKPHHPAFIIKLKDLCVTETDKIQISCVTYGPNLSYKWLKDDIVISPSDRVHFIEDENVLTLEILDSRPKDTADYTLKIFNEYKTVECVSYVNVAEMGGYQDEPCPAYIESINDYFHFIDDKLMIECKVKGIPRPRITWYKEDMQIHDWMPEYSFIEEAHGRYILVVNHPTEQDIGVYTLEVENDRGTHIRKHCVQFLAKRPATSSKLNYRAYRFLC